MGAFDWYHKAVVQGDANAQFNFGIILHNGNGVPPNKIEATKWFLKAADQGSDLALQLTKAQK